MDLKCRFKDKIYVCTRFIPKAHKHHMNDPTRSIGHICVITNYIWKI